MMQSLFVIPIVIFVSNVVCQSKGRNVVCYYSGDFGTSVAPPELLDANLCTHLNYAFVKVNENGNLVFLNKNVDIDQKMYERTIKLKKNNSNLKVLLSIGDTPAQVFSTVAADPAKRQAMVSSSLKFVKTYGFDGIDIDWEIPEGKDKQNFISLLKLFKESLGRESYTFMVTVYNYPESAYDVPQISRSADMINLMCYDFYGSWSKYTGYNAALFASPAESDFEKNRLNVAKCIQNWLNAGAANTKVNVGVPFYGRTFKLANPNDHKIHSAYVGTPGSVTYQKICSDFKEYTEAWDDVQKVPFKYSGDQWITYDNERSIAEKVKYIKSQNVAGVMVWQIAQDDIKGACGPKQGLLTVVKNNL
ncbi:acidic mammalian chitinase [Diabrotica virgifera virgifera]|uniref:Acidic mammalian chitinase-like n=1 Tax=Diabrotica virgifera virgifera TaxID=50390 RepID=A0A6P7FXU4_DIAVI|nr:acidic mammalian chitinase [Diabrotica virgifera virgifera]